MSDDILKQAGLARDRFVREALDRLNPVTDAPEPYIDPSAVIHQRDGSEPLLRDLNEIRSGIFELHVDDTGENDYSNPSGWWVWLAVGFGIALWLFLRWRGL